MPDERVAATIAVIVAVIAAWSLAGYLLDRPWVLFEGAHPSGIRSSTAVAALALSFLLLDRLTVLQLPRVVGIALPIVTVLAASSCIAGAAELSDAVLDRHRMSYGGASAVMLLLASLLGLGRAGRWVVVTDACALVAFGLTALVLYAYGIDARQHPVTFDGSRPLFVGSLLMCLLACALLIARPGRGGIAALFASTGAGGSAVRSFVPVALLVPLGLEALRHQLERDGMLLGGIATFQTFVLAILLSSSVLLGASHLERVEQRLRHTREALFMSTLSHELRTPLVAMRNLAVVVDDGWDEIDEELRRGAVRTTREQSGVLLALLHDTSQLRRLDAGSLPGHPTGVALCDGIEAAVRERGMHVQVQCPSTLRVWVDPEHLRLLLGACLRLGLRSGPGPVSIQANASREDVCVRIEVPTRPASADPTARDPAGWSLWTVAELARQWNGDASFERIDAERSCFVVTLPLAVGVPTEFRA